MKNDMYGFLLIDTEKKKKKFGPRKQGDEYFSISKKWYPCARPFNDAFDSEEQIYRRPLVLPSDPEWELVGWDENLSIGCEFTMDGEHWRRYSNPPQSQIVKDFLAGSGVLAIRRRKQAKQAESGWVLTMTRLPQDDRLYIVQTVKGDFLTNRGSTIRECSTQIGQWLDYPNPEPVKSEGDECMKAYFEQKFVAAKNLDLVSDAIKFALTWNQAHAKGETK